MMALDAFSFTAVDILSLDSRCAVSSMFFFFFSFLFSCYFLSLLRSRLDPASFSLFIVSEFVASFSVPLFIARLRAWMHGRVSGALKAHLFRLLLSVSLFIVSPPFAISLHCSFLCLVFRDLVVFMPKLIQLR